jgi:hypothetical protein
VGCREQCDWQSLFDGVPILGTAFAEQCACIRSVYESARAVVRTEAGVPPCYVVALGPLPDEQFAPRRNLFSTLFLAVYQVLGVPPERRQLYGCINQLFRIWVTSADNLLDAEDKAVLPVVLQGRSRVMREVISVMAADRVLSAFLRRAVEGGVVSPAAAEALSVRSLQVLLPSAAQEAGEEGGVLDRPRPEEVLSTVHPYKTGLLFHLPFLGPELVDQVEPALLGELKQGLQDFGLGCQVLDDIRDMATDYCDRRHNYVLSQLCWEHEALYADLAGRGLAPEQRLYQGFPELAGQAARLGFGLMRDGLDRLRRRGLGIAPGASTAWACSMFDVLDLGDLKGVAGQ